MNTKIFKPDRHEFRALAKQGNLIPVYTELVADTETPVSAFQKIDSGSYSFLLESAEHIDHGGRYSFVGSNPRVVFRSRGREIRISEDGHVREFTTVADPLAELQTLMARFQPVSVADMPRFSGGAVGFLGFDVVRFFEPTIGEPPRDDLQLPESVFFITNTLLIFDHQLRRLRVLANAHVENDDADRAYDAACACIREILRKLEQPADLPGINIYHTPEKSEPRSNTEREAFLQMVRDAKEFIHA